MSLLGLSGLGGCKEEPKKSSMSDAGQTEAVASASPSNVASPQPSVPALMDLPGRFQYEATHRPAGTVTAEQVFDAITAQGEVLTDRKQHLANPFGAQYCQGAKAEKERQFFSVCEYGNELDAEKGIPLAEAFGKEHRTTVRNGSSVLIARYEGTADTSKAEQIFRSLKPIAKP